VIRHCASIVDEDSAAAGRLAVLDQGARWSIEGALTFTTAAALLAAAEAMALPLGGVVDCAGVAAVDSAGVAVLLALKRRAAAEGRAIAFTSVPTPLRALADVYAVEDLLGLA
jgi:phospholipid transport system transporter-binding protein